LQHPWANCHASSLALSLTLPEQEAEENFDLALLATLEIDIIPHLGADKRVPDRLLLGFGKCLARASLIAVDERLTAEDYAPSKSITDDLKNGHANGTAHQPPLVPRERYSYWCFDLLCLLCSNLAKGSFEGYPEISGMSSLLRIL